MLRFVSFKYQEQKKLTQSGVRGLIGKLAVNELSKVNPTAHTTQSVANL